MNKKIYPSWMIRLQWSFGILFAGFLGGWLYQYLGVARGDGARLTPSLVQCALLGGIFFILVFLWRQSRNFFLEVFSSLEFASLLGIFLVGALLIGTLVRQNTSFADLVSIYGNRWTKVFSFFFLDDIFHAIWFQIWMLFLLLGLVTVTFRKKQFSFSKLGFFMAHMGVVFLIFGAWITGNLGFTGEMKLFVGQSKDQIWMEKKGKSKKLDFVLQLKKFKIETYPSYYKLDIYRKLKKSDKLTKISSGTVKPLEKKIKLIPNSDFQINIEKFFPHFKWKKKEIFHSPNISKVKESHIFSKVIFDWQFQGKKVLQQSLIISSQKPTFYGFPDYKLVLVFYRNMLKKGFEKKYPSGILPPVSWIVLKKHLSFEEQSRSPFLFDSSFRKKIDLGKQFKWKEYNVKVLKYSSNKKSIQVEVQKGLQKKQSWMSLKDKKKNPFQDLGLTLRYSIADGGRGFQSYLFFFLKKKWLVKVQNGKIIWEKKIPKNLILPEAQFKMTNFEKKDFFEKKEPINLSREEKNPAFQISFVQKRDLEQKFWVFLDKPTLISSKKTSFQFQLEKIQKVKQYKSHLALFQNSQQVSQKVVQINHPFWFGWYCIYQKKHNQNNLVTFQIAYDPGLFFVFLGLFLTALGVPYIFYIQPILKKKSKNFT